MILRRAAAVARESMPVDTTLLKLIATPLLVGAASLAARRWGHAVSGWVVGLPLTSGPIAFFLALDQGTGFAAAAALGSLAGTIGQAGFCVVYGRVVARHGWIPALAAGSVGFGFLTLALQRLTLPAGALALLVVAALAVTLVAMPSGRSGGGVAAAPRWDIPGRMVVTTLLVLGITGAAPVLGPRASGVLATFPVYGAILASFAHRRDDTGAAIRVLRGLLLGLFAFAGFFVVLGAAIEPLGVAPAFAAAIVTALAIQAGTLRFVVGRG